MIKHDFYADPTVFDHWQSNARGWVCSRLGRVCPYGWFAGFLAAAAVFALVGVAVFANLLQHAPGSEHALVWNQLLAQAVTVVIALVASIGLFDQAIKAWPAAELPALLVRMARARGLATDGVRATERVDRPATATRRLEREAVQEFFAEVRAAGVNVTIARALFRAGIRSARQLTATGDAELLGIPGVGPATLHRLRSHFVTR